jgi:Holliday junction resolvasome RuvABC endonuclease subunit
LVRRVLAHESGGGKVTDYAPLPGVILFLDLAGTIGWAAGRKGDDPPAMGAIKLPDGPHYGNRLMAAENALIDLIETHRPARIVCEAPLRLKAQSNAATARWLYGLLAYCHGEAARYQLPVEEVDADKCRKAVLGQSRVTADQKARGLTMKILSLRYCRYRGWNPPTHDAADAAVMFYYVMTRR